MALPDSAGAGRLIAAAVCLWAGGAAAQDGVLALCTEHFSEDACICASDGLQAGIDPEDFALYDAIGVAFIGHRAAGAEYVAAWDAASAEVRARMDGGSDLTRRTNAIGRAHRDAIRACGE